MTTPDPWPGDPAVLDDLVDHVERLVRRLARLGDDLADGVRALAWRGLARERFDDLLATRLDDLGVVADRLARAGHDLTDRHLGGGGP